MGDTMVFNYIVTFATILFCVYAVSKTGKLRTETAASHTTATTELRETLDYAASYRQALLELTERLMLLNQSTNAYELAIAEVTKRNKDLEKIIETLRHRMSELNEEITERRQESDDLEIELAETKRALLHEERENLNKTVAGVPSRITTLLAEQGASQAVRLGV